MGVFRRRILQSAAGGIVATTKTPARVDPEAAASLCGAAAKVGLQYGSTSDADFKNTSAGYADLFIRHCCLFAPQMPWSRTAAGQFAPDPGWEDPNIRFAGEHGMRLTGGHLLWHNSTPSWFDQLPSRTVAEQAISRHIEAMTARYGQTIYSWNVVNEAIEPQDGRPDGLRNSQLLRKLGEDYIASAFFLARKYAPNASLVYNEFDLELARPADEARRRALLRLLDRLKSAGAPIDAVGLQSHLRQGVASFDPQIYRNFLREIAERDIAIIISELDVLEGEYFTQSIETRDANVASLYRAFLETALDERAVTAVICWGLVDRYSWVNLQHRHNFTLGLWQPARPALFDDSLKPKLAFDAVLAAFRGAPPRPREAFNLRRH